MATGSPSTAQAIAGGPKPAPSSQSEAVQSKRDLASWWKQFKRSDKKPQEQSGMRAQTHLPRILTLRMACGCATNSAGCTPLRPMFEIVTCVSVGSHSNQDIAPAPGIFGIPLHTSIRYANVAISLFNDEGQSYIYGYVPIVVAKCGVFLKEKGE